MSNLNKGRFKCADEAQAAWNLFVQIYSTYDVNEFKKGGYIAQHCLSQLAHELYKARLINGSIYDEHGRIEGDDLAQAIYNRANPHKFVKWKISDEMILSAAKVLLERGEIRGTIFFEVKNDSHKKHKC